MSGTDLHTHRDLFVVHLYYAVKCFFGYHRMERQRGVAGSYMACRHCFYSTPDRASYDETWGYDPYPDRDRDLD